MKRLWNALILVFMVFLIMPSIAPARSDSFGPGHVKGTAFMTFEDFEKVRDGYSFILRNGSTGGKSEFYILVKGKDFTRKTVFYKRLYIQFLAGNEKKPLFVRGHNDDICDFVLEYEEVPARDVRIIND